jgi:hypothetical protein
LPVLSAASLYCFVPLLSFEVLKSVNQMKIANISDRLIISGIVQVREGTLNISKANTDWICADGSCRFKTAHWTRVPFEESTIPAA